MQPPPTATCCACYHMVLKSHITAFRNLRRISSHMSGAFFDTLADENSTTSSIPPNGYAQLINH
eukprot:12069397-Prorocentrum_lima.AAC.1